MTRRAFPFPSTLRGRLTIWYLSSVLAVSIILTLLFSVILWVTLHSQIDHHIHIVVNEAGQIVQNYQGEEREKLLQNLVSARGMTVVLLSPDGSPILQTNSADVASISEHQMQELRFQDQQADGQPIHFTVNNIRFATVPVQISAGNGTLAVGYSIEVVEQTFRMTVLLIALFVCIATVPLVFIGHMLLQRSLTPLERIAETAARITSSQELSVRIREGKTTQELAAIIDALNNMLGKLEAIFEKEHEFFSDAAHTIKTPLAVLHSQIEGLITEPEGKKRALLTTISRTADMVQDLLFISRIETQKQTTYTPVSFSATAHEVSELAETLAKEKRISVSSHIQEGISIPSDSHLLRKAVGNIVSNAVKYTETGGNIRMSLTQDSETTVFTVKDTGVGISKKDLSHITERFYRGSASRTHEGFGLGMAITKAIVARMRGTLSITSVKGKGTTVSLIFPRA